MTKKAFLPPPPPPPPPPQDDDEEKLDSSELKLLQECNVPRNTLSAIGTEEEEDDYFSSDEEDEMDEDDWRILQSSTLFGLWEMEAEASETEDDVLSDTEPQEPPLQEAAANDNEEEESSSEEEEEFLQLGESAVQQGRPLPEQRHEGLPQGVAAYQPSGAEAPMWAGGTFQTRF